VSVAPSVVNGHVALHSLMLQDEDTVFPSKHQEPLNPVTQHHNPLNLHIQDLVSYSENVCRNHFMSSCEVCGIFILS